ncbi:MAG TPA: hypothetical protein VGZ25_00100, partial [Gemmataceae bacterium]|nr:hypothetical protein [Gemmataceae bacterium]
ICFGLLAILGGICALYIFLPSSKVPTYEMIRRQSKKYLKKYPNAKKMELLNALKSYLLPETSEDHGTANPAVGSWVIEQRRLVIYKKAENRIHEVVNEIYAK